MNDMVLGIAFDDVTHKVLLTDDGTTALMHLNPTHSKPNHLSSAGLSNWGSFSRARLGALSGAASEPADPPLWTGVYGEVEWTAGMDELGNDLLTGSDPYLCMTQAFYDQTQILIPSNAWILLGVAESHSPSSCRVFVFGTTWDLARAKAQKRHLQIVHATDALNLWIDPLVKTVLGHFVGRDSSLGRQS